MESERERRRYFAEWLESREECEEEAVNLHGLRLKPGETVTVRVKSKTLSEIRGTVKCYNKFWGTLILESDTVEVLIKVRDIVYVIKEKVRK